MAVENLRSGNAILALNGTSILAAISMIWLRLYTVFYYGRPMPGRCSGYNYVGDTLTASNGARFMV